VNGERLIADSIALPVRGFDSPACSGWYHPGVATNPFLLAWVAIIHLITGDLFLAANGLIAWYTIPDHWWVAALVLPLTASLMAGWYYEAYHIWRGLRERH
jgi:hypothetical protein